MKWLLVVVAACSSAEPVVEDKPWTPLPDRPGPVLTPAPQVATRPAQLTHVTIKALGMYCEESCPMRVRYALAAIPAIYELGFDLTKESIFVSYDSKLGPAKEVTRPMLVAIKEAGFDPWLAREDWPDGAKVEVRTGGGSPPLPR
jgi:hypothetical protein